MPTIAYADSCARIVPEIRHFSALVAGADFSTAVPSCGEDWDLARLVTHTGTIHRWVERMVRELAQTRVDRTKLDLGLPAAKSELAAWLLAGAEPLTAALRRADPDVGMWSWGADKHVRFWARRMVHETTVHRVDAELALGQPFVVATEVAVDGIDELLENTPSTAGWAPSVAEIKGQGETIAFEAQDAGASWIITLVPDGYRWARAEAVHATARVRAAAVDLYLLLWARLEWADSRFGTAGDATLLADFLRNLGT